jgi:predicted nucleic acid-binding protein
VTYLIDTSIISEVRKGPRCDANVASCYGSIDDADLYLSVLVQIRKGVELARPRDPARAEALEAWLADIDAAFGDRVLAVDRSVSDEWGRMSAIRPVPVIDGLLAATAKTHKLTLVTRNDADVGGLGARVLNPSKAIGSGP